MMATTTKIRYQKRLASQGEAQNKMLMEGFDKTNTICNVYLSAYNTIAGNMMFDSIRLLEKNNMYDSYRRKYGNMAYNVYEKYERLHTSNFGDKYSLFLDYMSSVEEIIKKDIDILVMSIKNVLDKYNEDKSDVKAFVYATKIIIEMSCMAFDKIMQEARSQYGMDYTRFFSKGKLSGCKSFFGCVADSICRTKNKELVNKVSSDDNVKLSINIIGNKLASEDFLNIAGYMAIKENINLLDDFSKEELEELEKRYGAK